MACIKGKINQECNNNISNPYLYYFNIFLKNINLLALVRGADFDFC